MSPIIIESIGYLASALIVVSLAMTSVVRLRIISLLGSLAYTVYGSLIGAWPVVIANGVIVLLNIWNLRKEFRRPGDLGVASIDASAPFLEDFLKHHLPDIHRHMPEFEAQKANTAYVYMREGMPAGAVMGVREGTNLHLTLDYVLPAFRDSRLGKWLYREGAGALTKEGITTLTASPGVALHRDYLVEVGFSPDPSGTLRKALP
ncbi:GNAT family N-acetyltransferase [Tessaracoccus lapidicaptus]|uniref:GNAT family N-acetyltransferase n=1 Tax=Tessaracoccus lapidicaptus TaxID=1427523 RepID=UPI0033402AC0